MSSGKLRGRLEKKDITKSGVAQLATKRPQFPCWCGRATYRLNAELSEVCRGCDEPSASCDCKPLPRTTVALIQG